MILPGRDGILEPVDFEEVRLDPENPTLAKPVKPRRIRFLTTVASTLLLAPAAFAANTWDGGGADGNWSNNLNWDSDSLPNYGSPLSFGGSTGLTSNNDGATSSIVGITFNSGAGAFTLSGSSVTLGGNITNNSATAQTINLPLVLDANRTISTSSGNITLGGPISGPFSLIKSAGNTLTMNTAGSSFSRLQINAGTVKLGVNDALSTAGGFTTATAAAATLDLNGKTQTMGGTIVIAGTAAGTVTISDTAGGGVLKLGNDVSQNSGSLSNVTISAALDLNGATRSFTLNNSATTFDVSGVISNSGGTAGLTKAGVGTLTLSGANTFNGNTTVSAGLLTLNNASALQNSTLDTTASIASSNATTGLKTTATTLTLGGLSGDKNLASLFHSTNGYGGVTALTLNPALGQTPSYSGIIANGASGMTVTKTGAGTQVLTVANSYTGGTAINGGILSIGNAAALGTTGTISFGGGTLQYNGITTDLSSRFSTAANQAYRVDTNGQTVTWAGALASSGGSLTKTGGGTLILTGGLSNSFGGAVAVNGGILAVTDGTSLKNVTGAITVASGAAFNYSRNFGPGNDLANALTLSGAGAGGLGALNLFGNVTATGAITLAADATISHNFNNATISGSITGTDRNLQLTTLTDGQLGMVISGPIQLGTGGVTVTGAANSGAYSVQLSGNNTYSGGTSVTSGTLLVNNTTGSGTGSGIVSVDSGATLGGTGRINGAVNVTGVLAPGEGIESLGTGTLTLNNGSNFKYEMNTSTVGGDLLYVTGGLNIGSNVTLELTDLAALSETLAADSKLTLFSYTGVWNSGTFNGYADDSVFLFANNQWRIDYNDSTGGLNFASNQAGASGFVTLTAIPEPSSLGLLCLGALLMRRRRGN